MFDHTFLVPEQHHASSLRFLASVIAECAVIALFIGLSIALTARRLPVQQLKALLIVPRPPVSVAPTRKEVHTTTSAHFGPKRFIAPLQIVPLRPSKSSAESPAQESAPTIEGGVPGAGVGESSDLLLSVGEAAPPAAPPMPRNTAHNGPVAIGGAVAEANLINKVLPAYPPLARAAHVQGTVVFRAAIGKDGRIANLQIVSGHPLLVKAAQDAVLQWRYRPTLLNGAPVEVATEITVHFSLGSPGQ